MDVLLFLSILYESIYVMMFIIFFNNIFNIKKIQPADSCRLISVDLYCYEQLPKIQTLFFGNEHLVGRFDIECIIPCIDMG